MGVPLLQRGPVPLAVPQHRRPTLRLQHPDNPVLHQLSDDARLVVSEPLGDLHGAWREVPESTCLVIQGGREELPPFCADPRHVAGGLRHRGPVEATTMTALTVWRYDTPFGAEAAAVRLKRLEERKVLTVHDAITIAWMPQAQEPVIGHLKHPTASSAGKGSVLGGLVGMLVLAPVAGAALGAGVASVSARLRKSGIDEELVRELGEQLTPGSSALLVLSSDGDLDEVRPRDGARARSGGRRAAARRALCGRPGGHGRGDGRAPARRWQVGVLTRRASVTRAG